LAKQFHVGRPLVREALRTLVARGIVEVQVGRGAFVRRVGPGDAARPVSNLLRRQAITARQLVEARSTLESAASQWACSRITAAELDHMHELVRASKRRGTLAARVRNDLEFHLSVVRAAHNPVIETMFDAILGPTADMMLRSLSDAHVSREGLPYHEQIYLAIKSGDEVAAARASRGHLEVSERMYGADMDIELDVLMQRLGRSGHPISRERLSVDDILVDDILGAVLEPSSVADPKGGGAA
jgi:DNA-binding FadR family transcriptional regulator